MLQSKTFVLKKCIPNNFYFSFQTVHCDDEILDVVHEKVEEAKDILTEGTTEKKGIFASIKEKVSGFVDSAVDKSKKGYNAAADVISTQYDKLKDKFTKKDEPSAPVIPSNSDVPN